MSTQKNRHKSNFWLVLVGLFLLIGLIAGGALALDNAGLIGVTAMPTGGEERMAPPDFDLITAADGETFNPPDRNAHAEGDASSAGLIGLGKLVGQLALIISVVYYAQKFLGWLETKFRKPKLNSQTA